ncbi:hypothetical protein L6250_02155 [Candidatus Parcubacteria bacterium]|nr:DUF11 domain-containing protein [Patescibacteria group bacterium]MBU4466685.1 DUF11 domain-containing protein [Patescibacteria group bacterium]MCG2688419.1 hypothetical protein [Candidatus Parcubacteria bacterium]
MKKTIILLAIFLGGVLPFGVLAASLNVELSAAPSSGPAPLNGVDLTAVVSGMATGNIIYRFDCLNDGGWEKIETTANTTYTAVDLCNYPNSGSYLAKVSVERQGLVFDGTIAILVQGNPNLSVILSASPSSGLAPLNGVDLIAQVSGSAAGDVTYKFDCTSDSVWDRITTTSSTTYTAIDLCNYSNPGTYTATVQAERGGLSFQGTTGIAAQQQQQAQTLYASLEAIPNSGNAPLNGVDLRATATGTATGLITYRFDCTSDGIWDQTFGSISENPKTAIDACNYQNVGTYIAKVRIERGTASAAEATATVVVGLSGTQDLSVNKLGRNLSDNTAYGETTISDPGEVIEFNIFITATGNSILNDIIVKDTLPANMSYYGSFKVDNVLVGGDILAGLNIGTLNPQQTKTITFQAVVAQATNFAFGTTNLINTVLVYNTSISRTDTASVNVVRTQVLGVTDVPTGVLDSAKIAMIVSITATILLTYFMLLRFYVSKKAYTLGVNEVVSSAKEKITNLLPKEPSEKAEQRLNKIIEEIRNREKNT